MTTQPLRIGNGRLIDLLGALIPQAGNLSNIGTYFALGGEVFSILKAWGNIDEPFTTKVGLQSRMRLVVQLGELYTARTPGTDDDTLVAQLKAGVENDQVMEFCASLLSRFQANAGDNKAPTLQALQMFVDSDDIQAQVAEVAAESQIDIATILEIIQLIAKVIAMFKSNTPAVPTGGSVINF